MKLTEIKELLEGKLVAVMDYVNSKGIIIPRAQIEVEGTVLKLHSKLMKDKEITINNILDVSMTDKKIIVFTNEGRYELIKK